MTQVTAPAENHLFHSRLTHTLQTAQIARRIAEKLIDGAPNTNEISQYINPDVVEAAALAHDLGHPPFGHTAERELDILVKDFGDEEGFEGNAQSFRILTRLSAHRKGYLGLNLSRATLNAVLKYPWKRDLESTSSPQNRKFGVYSDDENAFAFAREGYESTVRSVEAQIMDYADDVAYSVHDLDDFLEPA